MSETSAAAPIRLDVYSDYTCPWCYIGWARLRKALDAIPTGIDVDVRWRPLEIHPEVPPEGMPVERLGYPPERWAAMQEALRDAAAEEGLDVSKRPEVSNTRRALAAGAHVQAEQPERFPAFHEALFEGYFARGLDLGDPDVVTALAEQSGVDRDTLDEALADGSAEAMLAETSAETRRLGITGTPTFLFGGRYVVAGAQPAELLARALVTLAEDGS